MLHRSIFGLARRTFYSTIITVGCAVQALTLVANASEMAASATLAAELIEITGVASHLVRVPVVIYEDGLATYLQCGGVDKAQFKTAVDANFGEKIIVQRAVNVLRDALESDQLEAVKLFFDSPVGMRIVAAETRSKYVTETDFNVRMKYYLDSSSWTQKRQELIVSVYDSIQAARFVSTLNGELLVATTLSAHCDTTDIGFEKLQVKLEQLRSEARFVEPIMKGDLVAIIATIFKDLPDSDLDSYLEFSQTDAGVVFFEALLESTRLGILQGLSGMRQMQIENTNGENARNRGRY